MDLLELYFASEQGLDSENIRIKRMKMAGDVFQFYRGAAIIFYHLWRPPAGFRSPKSWICGDAHWENVGSYKGQNHIAYFDLTDFDQACLAPASLDLGRALTCLFLTGQGRHASLFMGAYRQALVGGKPFHIEPEVAKGTVARLLKKVGKRSQGKFIAQLTKHGRIVGPEDRISRLKTKERRWALQRFRRWSATMDNPQFYSVLDIVGSAAGVGILGYRRYLVLVRGRHAPHIIDMKEAVPSDAAAATAVHQPRWTNQAERIADVQRMVQYMPIARLGWTGDSGPSFVMSEFQPAEDRVDSLSLSPEEYEDFIDQWGKLLAWAHLRGSGWKLAATTSDMIAFGQALSVSRRNQLIQVSRRAARRLRQLHSEFRRLTGTR
jgi:uncharacterized protein (DUF2252 family)